MASSSDPRQLTPDERTTMEMAESECWSIAADFKLSWGEREKRFNIAFESAWLAARGSSPAPDADGKIQMYNLGGEYPDLPTRLVAWPDLCTAVEEARREGEAAAVASSPVPADTQPRERGDYEYRLSWQRPSPACVMAHGDVVWESLTSEEWDGLPWEEDCLIAADGTVHERRHTLEGWAEYHYEPVRSVRFERRLRRTEDEGWDEVAVRGATGVTHWKRAPVSVGDEDEKSDRLVLLAKGALHILDNERAETGVDEWDESDPRCFLYNAATAIVERDANAAYTSPKDAEQLIDDCLEQVQR